MKPPRLKILGIVLIVAGAAIYCGGGGPENNPPASLVGVLTMLAGLGLHFRGRQLGARASAAGVLGDSRPDVVYLRAFRADISTSSQALIQGLTTDEEQLADVLRPFGDLVAIGRPSEKLPPPGAARLYASDAEWQETVAARIAAAPLVVLRAGVGEGLLWEMEHAVQKVDSKRLIVWIQGLRKSDYARFCQRTNERLGITLPPIEPFGLFDALLNVQNRPSRVKSGFIRFSQAWQPTFLPLPRTWAHLGYNDLRKSLNLALRPVFEENALQWHALGRFW